jgi:hypothetical protein
MLPPNTVEITALTKKEIEQAKGFEQWFRTVEITKEQCRELQLRPELVGIWINTRSLGNPKWTPYLNNDWVISSLPNACEWRIQAHDYRHYFGEVVDLATKVEGQYLRYLDNAFQTVCHTGCYHIHRVEMGYSNHCKSGTEPECKQWLIDHFTAIAAKDLPNYNLKFIFS